MKKITKQVIFSAALLSSLLFVGCYEEDLTGQSTIEVAQNPAGTVQFVAPLAATQTVNEKNQGKYQYKLNITTAQPVDIYLDVKVKSGTAKRGEDFDFDEHLLIKAYTTSVTGNINIINDAVFEPTETFVLEIGGDVDISNASIPASTISFSIVNGLADNLDLKFNYDKSFLDGTATKTLCGIGYDMDFFVLNDNLVDTGNYQAAASGCPEILTVSPTKFANGTYHIYHDLYDNKGLPSLNTPEFTVPISVDYNRGGGTKGTFNQEAAFSFTSKAATSNNYVISIVVKDGVYTLLNSKKNIIATAKTSNKILEAIQHARANNKK